MDDTERKETDTGIPEEELLTGTEEEILPETDDEIIGSEQDVSASGNIPGSEDLSYLFEEGDDEPDSEWLEAVIGEAPAEEDSLADTGEEADESVPEEENAEEDEISDGGDETDAADDEEYGVNDTPDGDGAEEPPAGGGEGVETDDADWRESTVSTQNFEELYGDEIRAFLSDRIEADPIEEYEEEHPEEEDAEDAPKKKKRRKKHYFIRFLAVVGIIAAAVIFMMSSYFDVKKIDVKGANILEKKEIIKMSGIKEGTNIFKLHTKDAEQELLASSYISAAEVKRDLPGTVVIKVLERRESAAVKYGKKYLVIDPDGYVLRTAEKLPKLTLFSDMKIKEIEVGELLEVTDEKEFGQALEIVAEMKKTQLYFKKIEFDKNNVKAYIYDKLVCVGTYENLIESIKNGNLEQVARDLYSKKVKKGTVKIDGGKFISYEPAVE